MLLLALPALAHVPHDLVAAVALPADGDPARPWFTFLDPQGAWLWLRSDDAGESWAFVGGEPMGDEPSAVGRLGDTLLILGSRGLWWSEDEGDTWALEPTPGDVAGMVVGDEVVVGGPDGLWTGAPALGWTHVTDAPILLLGPGAAIDAGGQPWVDRDGWIQAGSPRSDVSALLFDGASLYVGATDGLVRRWDGSGWVECGALPTSDHEYNDVGRLATMGGLLVATTSDGGPYASADGCATWSVLGVDQTIDHGPGGPESEATAQMVLAAYGDTWVFGGWAGLYLSRDDGATWTSPPLIPAAYTRGVAFSPDWPDDPAMYVAAYAAGAQRTDDGGRTWTAPGHGLSEANAQAVHVSPFDAATVYGIFNHVGYVSRDAGETWELLDPEAPPIDKILTLPTPGRLWEVSATLRESLDDGLTWADRDDLGEAFSRANVAGYVALDDRVCVTLASPSGLACSDDDEATWTVWSDEVDGEVTPPRPWPTAAPTHLVWGDLDGLHRQALADDTREDIESEPIVDLVGTPDDLLFAATRSSQLLRSDDGGASWAAFGPRLSATVMTVEARPDWLDHPELLVGSHDGLFVVDAAGDAERIDYERIDDASSFLQCHGCPPAINADAASFSSRQPVGTGTLVVPFRGTRVRVTGLSRPGDGVELLLDGEDHGAYARDAMDGTLLEIEGLAPGWHDLQLVGMPGTDVAVDVVEAWADGAILELPEPEPAPEGEDCGCGGGGGGAAGIVVGLGALARAASARRPRCASAPPSSR